MSTIPNPTPTDGLTLAIPVDDNIVFDHFKIVVRSIVEEALNAMLDIWLAALLNRLAVKARGPRAGSAKLGQRA